jgi:hypothetical protein
MIRKFWEAAAICAFSLLPLSSIYAQGLPALTNNPIGSFLVRGQTAITDNDPGVNSSYSIVGGGNELWGPADKGIFGYFSTSGDFDVKVRVDSLEPVHRYAKTGLMVRESLSATSRMVSLFATPTGPTQFPADTPTGEDAVEFNFRRASGDGSNSILLGSPGYPNAWLRLARRGNVFYGLVSHDGTNWINSSFVDTSAWPAGAFKSAAFLGLGSSSHDDTLLVKSELRDFSPVTDVGPVQVLTPVSNVFGVAGSRVNFSVGLNDPVDAKYQWFANNTAIPGATNGNYTTPTLTTASDATQYKVSVTGKTGSAVSSQATLSVVPISAPDAPDLVFDFDDGEVPFGARVWGTAAVDPSAGVGSSGGLVLVPAQNNQSGSFVIDDYTGGAVVNGFTVSFKLKIGPGSAKPADGFSFSYGTNLPNAIFPAPQQGVGPGLAVSFDLYDNGNGEAPAIDVFYGVDPAQTPQNLTGNILHQPMPLSALVTSRYVDVVIRMNTDGKLDLLYDGQVIAYHLQTPFTPVAGARWGFGAYAGGQNAFEGIDDIQIQASTLSNEAYLGSMSPLGNNVSATPLIKIDLVDLNTTVDTNSIRLQLNNAAVTPAIRYDANVADTTVSYAVPTLLPTGSTNVVAIVWSDSAGTVHTNTSSFRIGSYAALPASPSSPLSAANSASPGFRVRIAQIATPVTPTATFAEGVLAGEKGTNIADLTLTDENGYFSDPTFSSVMNYDVNSSPLGLSTFPGIPGITDSKENFVAEILTAIAFPQAGFYQMAIRSDDGFVLTEGDENSPVTVGAFEGTREPSDTIFGFVVPQAGIYPFRMVYYQVSGGASLRWSSINSDGSQVLINDPADPKALRAYQSVGGGTATGPVLTVDRTGSGMVITWGGGGTLETTSSLTNPAWSPVPSASSPYPVPTGAGASFFRVRQ